SLVGTSMRTAAIKYVSKLEPVQASKQNRRAPGQIAGGDEMKTNTYAALLAAFGVAGDAASDWKSRTKVDTLFVVTDGLPTTGAIVDVPKLIDAITEMNRTRGLVIHVVVFDHDVADRIRGLAEKNGGKCVIRGFEGQGKPEKK